MDELWAEIRVEMCDFVGILLISYVLKFWDLMCILLEFYG